MKTKTSNVINVGDKRRQMNHFGDGGGRNDHTLLIRGDVLFIHTVDAPYNNRLHPLRATVLEVSEIPLARSPVQPKLKGLSLNCGSLLYFLFLNPNL